ncbi:MAG: hypothetical protein RLZZ165_453 [Bacteroidota bacterium]|jgi:hypothetical protein
MKSWILIVSISLFSATLWAQGEAGKPLRLGVGLLASTYIGDLNANGGAVDRFTSGASLSVQFASERLLSPQLNAGFGRIMAQDRELQAVDGVHPNTFVQTPFFLVDLRLKARFLRESPVHPSLSAGVGFLGYTPEDGDGNNLIDNYSTRRNDETYGSMTASFPLSAGFEVPLNGTLMVGLEYTYRMTASDYLDNVGRLGQRNGNDKLQSILLTLYITFDQDPASRTTLHGKDRH